MGYYVQIVESNYTIPVENLDQAYKAMCELNSHDDLKRGGSWDGGKTTAVWFAWMEENYPETCSTAKQIFEQIGFEVDVLEDGSLVLANYDNKTGQEDLFLEAVRPFATAGGGILWEGEDRDRWTTAV